MVRDATLSGTAISAEEITGRLWQYRQSYFPRALALVRWELEQLRDMRLVESAWSEHDDGATPRWRCGSAWNLDTPHDEGGSGRFNNTPPPNADGDGPDDNGGAGGLREVLSHPVLFSVNEDEFEAMLQAAVGAPE